VNYTEPHRTLFAALSLGALTVSIALAACGRIETQSRPEPTGTQTASVATPAVVPTNAPTLVLAPPTAMATTVAASTPPPAATPKAPAAATALPTQVPAAATAPPAQLPAAFAAPTQPPTIPVAAPGPAFLQRPGRDGALPSSISIPRFRSEASVVSLGMDGDGTMAVPSDPDTIGWYDFTGKVGIPGNAVLVGHVDWAGRLRAFGRLRDLSAGDQVDVVDALGRQLTYSVESVETIDAATPPTEYLTQHGPGEELTLITCGGAFDRHSHQYLSRVIVRAVRDISGSVGNAQ
jgi:LPXTG-site transpeptidase (sortase) family protein